MMLKSQLLNLLMSRTLVGIQYSSDEDEDPIVVRDRKIRRVRGDRLAVGNAFFTALEFKEVVLDYALSKGQNVVQDRWEKNKIGFICGMGGKCEWRVYCSYDEQKQMFLVKTTYLWHNYIPNGKCKILKSLVIGRLFMDKLRLDEKFMHVAIQNHIKEQ
ncbi:hypothetical protein V5N11_036397 [Cardamine amara subsp. amara]|uniref:Transposase MuDR plant domain-containing protein n=1 Tax=Cardamine amara subsp. amara TaxID=228776 RepID=A0ABD1A3H1_CARAN